MKKKILAAFLAATMTLSLAACGSSDSGKSDDADAAANADAGTKHIYVLTAAEDRMDRICSNIRKRESGRDQQRRKLHSRSNHIF